MAASFITHATGDKVATETFTQAGASVHLQKFLATNPLGQANAYGAGNADAATPRFTLATDDAAIAALIAAIGGISGGGTPYTQDGAAPTNPIGPALQLRRTDTLASVGADGDWITARATAKGEKYVKNVDTDARLGEVQASPTQYTVLDRLKTIAAGTLASLGIKTAANSLSVTHASDDSLLAAVGAKADTAATTDTGSFSLIALFKRGLGYLATIATSVSDTTTPVTAVGYGAKVPASTITTTNGAYSPNDVVGGKLTFPNMARVSAGGGLLQSVTVAVKAAVTPNMELWLFDADPSSTSVSDNGVWGINAADLGKVFAVVPIATADWKDGGTPNVVVVEHVRKYTLAATSMYGYLVDRTGATLTSTSDVLVTLEAALD